MAAWARQHKEIFQSDPHNDSALDVKTADTFAGSQPTKEALDNVIRTWGLEAGHRWLLTVCARIPF